LNKHAGLQRANAARTLHELGTPFGSCEHRVLVWHDLSSSFSSQPLQLPPRAILAQLCMYHKDDHMSAHQVRACAKHTHSMLPCSCCTSCPHSRIHLLQGNKSRRVRSTDTWSTVLDRLVRDGEFTQVVAHHLGLDFDLVELLAGVDTNDAADHLWHNDHVSEMCLDEVGLLVGLGLLLGLSEFLDQAHWSALEATVEPTAGAGMEDVEELVGWDIEESAESISGLVHEQMMVATYWSRSIPR